MKTPHIIAILIVLVSAVVSLFIIYADGKLFDPFKAISVIQVASTTVELPPIPDSFQEIILPNGLRFGVPEEWVASSTDIYVPRNNYTIVKNDFLYKTTDLKEKFIVSTSSNSKEELVVESGYKLTVSYQAESGSGSLKARRSDVAMTCSNFIKGDPDCKKITINNYYWSILNKIKFDQGVSYNSLVSRAVVGSYYVTVTLSLPSGSGRDEGEEILRPILETFGITEFDIPIIASSEKVEGLPVMPADFKEVILFSGLRFGLPKDWNNNQSGFDREIRTYISSNFEQAISSRHPYEEDWVIEEGYRLSVSVNPDNHSDVDFASDLEKQIISHEEDCGRHGRMCHYGFIDDNLWLFELHYAGLNRENPYIFLEAVSYIDNRRVTFSLAPASDADMTEIEKLLIRILSTVKLSKEDSNQSESLMRVKIIENDFVSLNQEQINGGQYMYLPHHFMEGIFVATSSSELFGLLTPDNTFHVISKFSDNRTVKVFAYPEACFVEYGAYLNNFKLGGEFKCFNAETGKLRIGVLPSDAVVSGAFIIDDKFYIKSQENCDLSNSDGKTEYCVNFITYDFDNLTVFENVISTKIKHDYECEKLCGPEYLLKVDLVNNKILIKSVVGYEWRMQTRTFWWDLKTQKIISEIEFYDNGTDPCLSGSTYKSKSDPLYINCYLPREIEIESNEDRFREFTAKCPIKSILIDKMVNSRVWEDYILSCG